MITDFTLRGIKAGARAAFIVLQAGLIWTGISALPFIGAVHIMIFSIDFPLFLWLLYWLDNKARLGAQSQAALEHEFATKHGR